MLTKKTKKSNTKTTTKKGYDLKEIKTKKSSQPEKKKGARLAPKNNTLRLRNLYKKLLADKYIYKKVSYFSDVDL